MSNLLHYAFPKLQSLLRKYTGHGTYLGLKPDTQETLLEKSNIHNDPPANLASIKSEWTPAPHWVDYYTNRVCRNGFKDVLVSYDGIVFTGIDAFSGSYVYPAFYEKFGIYYLLHNYKNRSKLECDNAWEYLVVHDHWSAFNYFHWICDSVPRLYLFKKNYPDKKIKVLLPSAAPQFVSDSVARLGYGIQFIQPDQYAAVRTLWHVDYLADSGYGTPYLVKAIRETAVKVKNSTTRRIYISRSMAPKRSINNEGVLIAYLKSENIEILHTEKLTLKEQMEIFSQTSVLISSHGAGLTNLAFMPQGSRVIEIGYSDISKQPVCYWTLANSFQHQYFFVPLAYTTEDSFIMDEKGMKLVAEALKA